MWPDKSDQKFDSLSCTIQFDLCVSLKLGFYAVYILFLGVENYNFSFCYFSAFRSNKTDEHEMSLGDLCLEKTLKVQPNILKFLFFCFLKVAIPLGWELSFLLFLIIPNNVQALYNNRAERFNILVVFVHLQ